jgi:hypothetical protein
VSFARLEAALPERAVEDFGAWAEVVDDDGVPLALVAWSPWQVEVELSALLVGEPEEAAELADARLRERVVPAWEARGFQVAEVGEVRTGETDDPEAVVWSYDLPVTILVEGPDHVEALLAWVERQPREFILWDAETLAPSRA